MKSKIDRRRFLKASAAGLAAGALASPLRLFETANAAQGQEPFVFAYLSDSHITHIGDGEFTKMFVDGLERGVAELTFMEEEPDFVLYGGDLAQLGKKEEIDKGLEIMSQVEQKVYWIMGEHDYYLDMGEYWRSLFGKEYYSFDHKGVHFVALNSILTYQDWIDRWPTPMDRMKAMAQLDNPQGSPFMVGEEQLVWLKADLEKYPKETPVIVFSHSPLYKYYKPWNFWTDDAEAVQSLLNKFDHATVIHGHIHQKASNRIGNINFHGVMSTAWPWPYPPKEYIPALTEPMNRADPFSHFDGCGWGWGTVRGDRKLVKHYELWENTSKEVTPETIQARVQGLRPPVFHY